MKASPSTDRWVAAIALVLAACQASALDRDASGVVDAGSDASMTARDATVWMDAARNDRDAGGSPDASPEASWRDAATDAVTDTTSDAHAGDAILDAQAPTDAAATIDPTLDEAVDAHVLPDASPSNDTDAGAPMCRSSGPCRTDDECCWFCHDQDHCHRGTP